LLRTWDQCCDCDTHRSNIAVLRWCKQRGCVDTTPLHSAELESECNSQRSAALWRVSESELELHRPACDHFPHSAIDNNTASPTTISRPGPSGLYSPRYYHWGPTAPKITVPTRYHST
ncbi:hypothetical protein J6590_104797, partial [Homalodisca vitripennis]